MAVPVSSDPYETRVGGGIKVRRPVRGNDRLMVLAQEHVKFRLPSGRVKYEMTARATKASNTLRSRMMSSASKPVRVPRVNIPKIKMSLLKGR